MSDLATIAAATAAGYARTQTDLGSGAAKRYFTRLERPITGGTGESGGRFSAVYFAATSAAAADTGALAALNAQRGQRWGTGATANKDGQGNSLTIDAT